MWQLLQTQGCGCLASAAAGDGGLLLLVLAAGTFLPSRVHVQESGDHDRLIVGLCVSEHDRGFCDDAVMVLFITLVAFIP
jgi:hypothetical protein